MTTPMPRPDVAGGHAVSPGTLAMVLATMLLLISGGVEIFMQAGWAWWMIPLACVAVIVVIVAQRYARRQRTAEQLRPAG